MYNWIFIIMNNLIDNINNFILENHKLNNKKPTIIGLSGIQGSGKI